MTDSPTDPLPQTAPGNAPQTAPGSAPGSEGNVPLSNSRPADIAPVEFSPPGGAHRTSVTVHLACATPNVVIRFARDASDVDAFDVDESGALYEGPILLMRSETLAARAWRDGVAGPLATAEFTVQKALWEVREPVDRCDAVAHEVAECAMLENGWRLAGASARGKLHAHRALWRDDWFEHAEVGEWSLIAVADGAGSAPLSRVGARRACESSLTHTKRQLADWTLNSRGANELEAARACAEPESDASEDELEDVVPRLRAVLVGAAQAALDALRGESKAREKPLGEFATTLLLLARTPWNGSQLCATLQVGDGACAFWNGSRVTVLGVADHGAHSSETRFLTTAGVEADFASRVLFAVEPDLRALAVMTDGVSDDFFPESTRLREVFEAVLPLVSAAGVAVDANEIALEPNAVTLEPNEVTFSPNETAFSPNAVALGSNEVALGANEVTSSVNEIALSPDGDVTRPNDVVTGADSEFVGPEAGRALLAWLGYEKKGSSDDRTLVISWCDEAAR